MKRRNILAIVMIAAVVLLIPVKSASIPSATGPPCADRKEAVESLMTLFGESLVGRGLSSQGLLFEMYASVTGTWTIIATSPTGKSCLIAAGDAWELVKSDVSMVTPDATPVRRR